MQKDLCGSFLIFVSCSGAVGLPAGGTRLVASSGYIMCIDTFLVRKQLGKVALGKEFIARKPKPHLEESDRALSTLFARCSQILSPGLLHSVDGCQRKSPRTLSGILVHTLTLARTGSSHWRQLVCNGSFVSGESRKVSRTKIRTRQRWRETQTTCAWCCSF